MSWKRDSSLTFGYFHLAAESHAICGEYLDVPVCPASSGRISQCRTCLRLYRRNNSGQVPGNDEASYLSFDIYERDNWTCYLCGLQVVKPEGWARRTYRTGEIDHVIPIYYFGPDTPENVATAHRWCNEAKGTHLDVDHVRSVISACRSVGLVRLDLQEPRVANVDPGQWLDAAHAYADLRTWRPI